MLTPKRQYLIAEVYEEPLSFMIKFQDRLIVSFRQHYECGVSAFTKAERA
jgi:hypothetical protein